mmetsp:Transcript_77170/g.226357  ORF Transcript_77170/g.226357 Transcript_77170/m.226357 type:complete len:252 (-) Transcript_77170:109-864(-)
MASPLALLALAAAAGTAAATSSIHSDAAALVQVGASLEPKPGACECLSWKDVYAEHGVKCGDGQEVSHVAAAFDVVCPDFYEKVSGNFCTNLHMFTKRTEQWCYVSSACRSLNGGGRVNEGVHWKTCKPGKDTMLSEMTLEELNDLAQREGRDPAAFMAMAYPMYEGLSWQDIQKCFTDNSGDGCAALKAVQATGKPTFFNSQLWHGPPYGVVIGSKAVECRFTDYYWHFTGTREEFSFNHMNEYVCVAGC